MLRVGVDEGWRLGASTGTDSLAGFSGSETLKPKSVWLLLKNNFQCGTLKTDGPQLCFLIVFVFIRIFLRFINVPQV